LLDVRDVFDHVLRDVALHCVEKDAVTAADHGLLERLPGEAESRPEVFLVNREQRAAELDAGPPPGGRPLQALTREELRGAFGEAPRPPIRKDQGGYAVARVLRRDVKHVAQAEVQRQLRM